LDLHDDATGSSSRAKSGLFIGLVLLVATLILPAPASMSLAAWHTTGVALLMAAWWVTEAIPIPATALVPLLLFPLLGISTMGAAASPYADPVIFLFMGGFLIAAAMQKCGLHLRIALTIINYGGVSPSRLVGAFMAATALLSMWVSNTATVAMMLPIAASVLALAARPGQDGARPDPNLPVALMLGVAYAASIGGVGTLIGTPPNALLAGFMSETYGIRIGFLEWMLVGVPFVLVGIPATWYLLTRVQYRLKLEPIAGGAAVIAEMLRSLGAASRAEWTVGVVTALTAIFWIGRPVIAGVIPGLSDTGIAMAGALLLFLIPTDWSRNERALDWEAAEQLPWGVLILFGGGLSLAGAIQDTGLATWIGTVLTVVAGWPTLLVVVIVSTAIVFLTELTSNTATAAALLPVVGALAVAIGVAPLTLAVPAAIGASCAFMLPVATPPNAIVYGSGHVTIQQMMRAGFALNLICIVLITLIAMILVPLVQPLG
jgi:sodium-dependent dicarboxylate transporter 2/3/5